MYYMIIFLWILFLAGVFFAGYGLFRKEGKNWYFIIIGAFTALMSLYDIAKVYEIITLLAVL